MNAEVARRRPAQVVSRAPIPAPTVRQAGDLTAPSRGELLAALGRLQRQGRVERTGQMRLITEGRAAGSYAVRVVLLPPRAEDPRWAVVCRNVGIGLTGVAALLGALAWLVSAMTVAALAGACITVLVAFGTWVYAKYFRRPRARGVTVTTITTVQMR